MEFKLHAAYKPTGDQPEAIAQLVAGVKSGKRNQVLLGTTGSGKSVCINSIIASMLFKFGPDELRFIMVDPKVVEMQMYNKLPHLVVPVVTDPKKVVAALKWVVNEMEKRYRVFAKTGVRRQSQLASPQCPTRSTSRSSVAASTAAEGDSSSTLLAFSRHQVLQPSVLDLNTVVTDMSKILARVIGEDVVMTSTMRSG